MKVRLINLGCRSNYFDAEFMSYKLVNQGSYTVSSEEPADVYIINTCTVTSEADRSSRQAIYRAKRENPRAIVVATGCYAQVNPGALAELKEVDIVVGNSYKHRIVEILEEFLENRGQRVRVDNIFKQGQVYSFDLITYFDRARPFLKIQEGCNNFCTFCIIPFARGKVRSVPMEKVIQEARLIADRGFQEIVLTGTQLTQYGWDGGTSLYELLKELVKIEGLELIRLSSLHPAEIGDDLLEFLLSEEKIAPHFHLSLQSGSNRILELMERGYTVKDYIGLVESIVRKRPLVSIGTDIIAGFPSETEEEHTQTCELLEELPIAYIHVFPYSDRALTKSSKMKNKVSHEVKEERVRHLIDIDKRKREKFYEKNLGMELRAVSVGDHKLLTENYLQITGEGPPGKVIRVKVL
ncbi:MAG: tRNA (N(6)-L-threonylcarbamoyladenosine(37)-C(2))-methylthiotransferase MtaB [Aquificaceae bacterium]|nr:tRNA (N(6)-L-threonylcarbamoyladenosine(37)-C(2))-methylthiotransferase MtaB [Aquificaceae bacterium]